MCHQEVLSLLIRFFSSAAACPIGPDGQLGDEGRRLKAKVSQLRRKTEIVNKTLNFTADLYIRQHLIA